MDIKSLFGDSEAKKNPEYNEIVRQIYKLKEEIGTIKWVIKDSRQSHDENSAIVAEKSLKDAREKMAQLIQRKNDIKKSLKS